MIKLFILSITFISIIFSLPTQFISNDNLPLLEIGKTISGSPIVAIEYGESNPVKEDSVIEKDTETDPIIKFINGPKNKS
uniref:Uncharacterized protein n=1 Tax=Strongyloides stercoralis TaxID=6248 RepID=A0A0K0ERD0_STRER